YCVSCDLPQLVTWYKAVISHVVSNDVTSDILLTILHVITDWPNSDHMIGTTAGTGSWCFALSGSVHKQGAGKPFINSHPTLHCHRPARLHTTAGREVV
ncbi:unnamed protein product, partial [Staurois parvus]